MSNLLSNTLQGDRIQVRDIRLRTVHPVFVSPLGGTSSFQILLYCRSGVNVLCIPLSDVTNSEHKVRQFSISQTTYWNDHDTFYMFSNDSSLSNYYNNDVSVICFIFREFYKRFERLACLKYCLILLNIGLNRVLPYSFCTCRMVLEHCIKVYLSLEQAVSKQ